MPPQPEARHDFLSLLLGGSGDLFGRACHLSRSITDSAKLPMLGGRGLWDNGTWGFSGNLTRAHGTYRQAGSQPPTANRRYSPGALDADCQPNHVVGPDLDVTNVDTGPNLQNPCSSAPIGVRTVSSNVEGRSGHPCLTLRGSPPNASPSAGVRCRRTRAGPHPTRPARAEVAFETNQYRVFDREWYGARRSNACRRIPRGRSLPRPPVSRLRRRAPVAQAAGSSSSTLCGACRVGRNRTGHFRRWNT